MKKITRYFIFLISNQYILLFLILLIAAFLRLYKIADYMTFLGDEGRDVLVAYNILHGKFTLLGPTSSVGGFFLGPIYYYFMAPFLWFFNYNPVGPAVMVALFGVATVFLIYKFSSDLFNYKVGLIAAFLYAISPLAIAYSRSSWNPNPLPFFSLLSLYFLYKGFEKNKLKLFFASGVMLGIAMQLHYLAIFLGAVMFFYILFAETLVSKLNLKKIFYSLIRIYIFLFIGFLIGWFPFLAFEIRHGFLDFKNIFDFILYSGNTGSNPNFFLTIYDVFFRLFGRLVFSFPPPEQLFKLQSFEITSWVLFVLAVAISSSVLLFSNLYKRFKSRNDNFLNYVLLFFWGFVGILLFGFYKKAIYDYYFSFMFPIPFILVGALLVSFYESKKLKLVGKILSVAVLLLIVVLNIQGVPFRYPPNRQLNQMETISKFVQDKTGGEPFNFALITGGNSDHAYRYFFTTWNRPPTTIEDKAHDPKRKTVTDQLFVVCESLPCEPLGHSLWEVAGFGRAEIAGHWNVSVVEVYKLVHYKEK